MSRPVDFNATAELFRRGQSVPAHGLKPPYSFEALIAHVMKKRCPDRQLYTIMVGKKVYDAAAIEDLSGATQTIRGS